MGAGESSWSRWTSTSAVEERGEIGIFGNKNFLKKKEEEGGGATSPQAGPQPAGGLTRPAGEVVALQAGRFNGFIFFIFLFLVFIYVIYFYFFRLVVYFVYFFSSS